MKLIEKTRIGSRATLFDSIDPNDDKKTELVWGIDFK